MKNMSVIVLVLLIPALFLSACTDAAPDSYDSLSAATTEPEPTTPEPSRVPTPEPTPEPTPDGSQSETLPTPEPTPRDPYADSVLQEAEDIPATFENRISYSNYAFFKKDPVSEEEYNKRRVTKTTINSVEFYYTADEIREAMDRISKEYPDYPYPWDGNFDENMYNEDIALVVVYARVNYVSGRHANAVFDLKIGGMGVNYVYWGDLVNYGANHDDFAYFFMLKSEYTQHENLQVSVELVDYDDEDGTEITQRLFYNIPRSE